MRLSLRVLRDRSSASGGYGRCRAVRRVAIVKRRSDGDAALGGAGAGFVDGGRRGLGLERKD